MIFAFAIAAITVQSAPATDVTYDEAIACAFLGIGYGLAEDNSREMQREIIQTGVRYIEAAQIISGKDQNAVIEDMGAASGAITRDIEASEAPRDEITKRWEVCAERASLLPSNG